jgi:methionyl aminopeptidase
MPTLISRGSAGNADGTSVRSVEMGIILKNSRELEKMREAGRIVTAVLDDVEAACLPGVTTAELNRIAAREIARQKARSAFLGYRPGGLPAYPAVLCTSINGTVVHGIPRADEVLREGDIIGVDFACFKDDYCADAARTIAVGVISSPARALLAATRECLESAIRECRPGQRLGDIGHAIETCAKRHGYSVVREFVGHGIGRAMHEPPSVPNYGAPGHGLRHRTDGQRRRPRSTRSRGRVDRRYRRPQPLRPRRAHRRHHRQWSLCLDRSMSRGLIPLIPPRQGKGAGRASLC